eukprot:239655-Amphidinium_carterae.1
MCCLGVEDCRKPASGFYCGTLARLVGGAVKNAAWQVSMELHAAGLPLVVGELSYVTSMQLFASKSGARLEVYLQVIPQKIVAPDWTVACLSPLAIAKTHSCAITAFF